MKNYFVNPELRKSSAVLFSVFLISAVIMTLFINYSFNRVKKDIITTNSALIGVIIKNHPELEEEVVPIITKSQSREYEAFGREILEKYQYNKKLEIGLMPELYNTRSIAAGGLLAFCIVLFCALGVLNFYQYRNVYDRIRLLNRAAKNVLEGDYSIELSEMEEGEFSKLVSSFNEMKKIIRNNMLALRSEKEFLVNLLSDISHQLKTPLAALMLYNDILSKKGLEEEKRVKFVANSKSQLERMEWLVKSLLKLAKLDTGAIVFEKRVTSIYSTLEKSIEILENQAWEKGVSLVLKRQQGDILMLQDEEWLSEAFINIIKNCIEHTSNGGEVSIDTEETAVSCKIKIRDNGEGIDKEELPHIFKRFYKGKRSKKTDSVGIGLSLSKSIVESHNGYIEVESEEGKGTTFTLVFLKGVGTV